MILQLLKKAKLQGLPIKKKNEYKKTCPYQAKYSLKFIAGSLNQKFENPHILSSSSRYSFLNIFKFFFCNNTSNGPEQLSLQEDLKKIKESNLLDNPRGFYDFLLLVSKYQKIQTKIQLMVKVIDYLRQKDVWRHHPQVYLLISNWMHLLGMIQPQQEYIFELKQMIKILQGKPQLQVLLSQVYFTIGRYLFTVKNPDFAKIGSYLQKSYKTPSYFQSKAILLFLMAKSKQGKYGQTLQALKIYMDFMSQSKQVDIFAGDVFRTKLDAYKMFKKEQKLEEGIPIIFDLMHQFNDYFNKWGQQIMGTIINKIKDNTKDLTTKQSQNKTVQIKPNNSLFQIPNLAIQIDRQIAELFYRNDQFDQAIMISKKYQVDQVYNKINSVSLGECLHIFALSYKNKNQMQSALKMAKSARQMFFRVNPQQINRLVFVQLFYVITDLTQQRDSSFLQILKIDEWLNKFQQLPTDHEIIIQEIKIRVSACEDLLRYYMSEKLQENINKLLTRLQKIKQNVHPFDYLCYLVQAHILSQKLYRLKQNYQEGTKQVQIAQNILNNYINSAQYKLITLQSQHLIRANKHFSTLWRKVYLSKTYPLLHKVHLHFKQTNSLELNDIQIMVSCFNKVLQLSDQNNQLFSPSTLVYDISIVLNTLFDIMKQLKRQGYLKELKYTSDLMQKCFKKIDLIKAKHPSFPYKPQDQLILECAAIRYSVMKITSGAQTKEQVLQKIDNFIMRQKELIQKNQSYQSITTSLILEQMEKSKKHVQSL